MKEAFKNTALFTLVLLALLIPVDLLAAFFFQSTPSEALAVHALLFIAVVLLSGAGAFAAYAALQPRPPARRAVVVSALMYGIASFFGIVWFFSMGGLIALAAWLVVGAAAFVAASPLIDRDRHG